MAFVKYGREKAAALAFAAFSSALFESDETVRFGCGVLKPNGFHGDARNEFYAYDLEQFSKRVGASKIDPRCETFAPSAAFCWNSVHVGEGHDLGRSVGIRAV